MTLFNRSIEVVVEEAGEDTLRLKGSLRDKRLGEDLHGIDVEMVVSAWDGEIKEISGSFPIRPMEECVEGLAALEEIVGAHIAPGFSDFVKKTVGSNRGCSHMAALIMNMGNTSIQGRGAYLRKNVPDDRMRMLAMQHNAEQLGLIDSCVSWREDGPLVSRWREEVKDAGEPERELEY